MSRYLKVLFFAGIACPSIISVRNSLLENFKIQCNIRCDFAKKKKYKIMNVCRLILLIYIYEYIFYIIAHDISKNR